MIASEMVLIQEQQGRFGGRQSGLLALLVALALGVGCAPRLLPGTKIEDTPDTHAILDVMERYRTAVENKDIPGVMALISKKFRDTAGTPTPDDDLDYDSLMRTLPQRLAHVADIKLDLDVRTIHVDREKGVADAIYYYTATFHLPGLNPKGQSEADLKQMWLRHEAGTWKIVSGL